MTDAEIIEIIRAYVVLKKKYEKLEQTLKKIKKVFEKEENQC